MAAGSTRREIPLEKQKSQIVNDLVKMNKRMKEFSGNLEGELDVVHKQGGAATAGKKYGYGGANQQDHIDMMKNPMTK